jgi:hypothetical protein
VGRPWDKLILPPLVSSDTMTEWCRSWSTTGELNREAWLVVARGRSIFAKRRYRTYRGAGVCDGPIQPHSRTLRLDRPVLLLPLRIGSKLSTSPSVDSRIQRAARIPRTSSGMARKRFNVRRPG